MEQLNRVEIRGNVGSIRLQPVGNSLAAHLTVATNYAYKDRSGAPVIETTWHNVNAWQGKGIDDLQKIERGDKIYVCGRFRVQKYIGDDQIERTLYEISARNLSVIKGDDTLQYEMN